jgi:hypothetical protein
MLTKSLSTWLLQRLALLSTLLIACFSENATAQTRPFINISTRAEVLGGQNIIVAGFIIQTTATTTKQVLIRGMGPSYGLSLADPTITLYGPNGAIYSNNNWQDDVNQRNAIAASGFQPGNDLESAILWNLPAGSYTVTMGSGNGGTGIGLVELYDIGGAASIVNLSSRAQVGTGDNALIAGLYAGDNTRTVVRAIGPTLANYGIQGALQDPTLELRNSQGTLIDSNDNWQSYAQSPEIQQLGLQPANGYESAILSTLTAPGPYTVVVRGFNNTTGIGMVELYALEDAMYPRIFQDFADADNLNEDRNVTVARHDLMWTTQNGFGWNWVDSNEVDTEDYQSETVKFTNPNIPYPIPTLRGLNPHIKILVQVLHYDLDPARLPANHSWWMRDANNNRILSPFPGSTSYRLNENDLSLQAHVANQARAMMQTGQFDGVMLDVCFPGTSYLEPLLTAVRNAIGPNGLIIVNANANQLTANELGWVNGVLIESGTLTTSAQWQNVKAALDWDESHTRAPRINSLEISYINSRNDLNLMRATTCLSLIHSNGFALFSNPYDHSHNWYDPFWSNHTLGIPTGSRYTITGNAERRDFKNGSAVLNILGNSQVTVNFYPEMRTSLATGVRATSFVLPPNDGGIYLY